MSFLSRYSVVIGGLVLLLVVVVLVSVPNDILAMQATFIGTEIQYASGSETPVKTNMEIGDAEHLASFPKEFGDWLGLDREKWKLEDVVGADVLLVRTYINTAYYQVIHFVVVQGKEPSSFHPPPVCYRAGGWAVEEESTEEVLVPDVSWSAAAEPVSITAKRLVAVKTSDGEVQEREIALYFYVKGRMFEDTVTMVQAFAEVETEGSDDDVLRELKGFVGEVVPLMFDPDDEYDDTTLGVHLARSWGGRALMGALVLIPLGIMIVPRVRRS